MHKSFVETTLAEDLVRLLDYHNVTETYKFTAAAGRSYGYARAWSMDPDADHRFVVEVFTLEDAEWHYGFFDEITMHIDLAGLMEFKQEPNDPVFERVHSANIRSIEFVTAVSRYLCKDDAQYVILRTDKRGENGKHVHVTSSVSIEGEVAMFPTYNAAMKALTEYRKLPDDPAQNNVYTTFTIIPI